MRLSISRLRGDDNAQYAFAIANKAMLMQMELNGPAPENAPYAWRPFQLAFFLMALESSIDEDSDFRDCVDLIWFPALLLLAYARLVVELPFVLLGFQLMPGFLVVQSSLHKHQQMFLATFGIVLTLFGFPPAVVKQKLTWG
jgi:hypothetical protein